MKRTVIVAVRPINEELLDYYSHSRGLYPHEWANRKPSFEEVEVKKPEDVRPATEELINKHGIRKDDSQSRIFIMALQDGEAKIACTIDEAERWLRGEALGAYPAVKLDEVSA